MLPFFLLFQLILSSQIPQLFRLQYWDQSSQVGPVLVVECDPSPVVKNPFQYHGMEWGMSIFSRQDPR